MPLRHPAPADRGRWRRVLPSGSCGGFRNARGRVRHVRIARIITRLNIGGPSIQAITLSERLSAARLRHAAGPRPLGDGEGDMRYLLAPSTRVEHVPRAAPRARAGRRLRRARAAARHPARLQPAHRPHAHGEGRHGRPRGGGDLQPHGRRRLRARASCTPITATCSRDTSAPARPRSFVGIERTARAAHRSHRRHLAGHPRRAAATSTESAAPISTPSCRSDSTCRPLAAIDDRARQAARAALGIPPDAPVVTTVGRLTAIKQHSLFLETARLIGRAHPAALFLIVGDGELRAALEDAARQLGLADRVRFLGWRRDLATIYGATDVFLLTSRNEGTPVALIESLAAGVPGVSTDVGGVRDVIDERRDRLLGAVRRRRGARRDPSNALLGDPRAAAPMGDRGRALVARALRHRSARRRHRRALSRAAR